MNGELPSFRQNRTNGRNQGALLRSTKTSRESSTPLCPTLVKRRGSARRTRAEETAEHHAEERMGGHLVGENASIPEERRPVSAAPVLVHAIDEGQRGPEREALRLRHDHAARDPAKAEALEGRAEERAVHEMDRDRRFRPDPDKAAEEPAVGIPRDAEGSPENRLGGRPDPCRNDARPPSPPRPARISSPPW